MRAWRERVPLRRIDGAFAPMRSREFVVFFALTLISGAMATDLMVPAVKAIDRQIGVGHVSSGQVTLVAFLFGVGCLQFVFGPLADRFGRRPVLIAGTLLFVAGGLLVSSAPDAYWLALARWTQGVGTGAMRVAAYAVARDRYRDGALARVFSLAMALLLVEPIVSPVLGQFLLEAGDWRYIASVLAIFGLALLLWGRARLDESLRDTSTSHEAPLAALSAYRQVLSHRPALRCMLAYGMVMGAHVGFLTSAQSIFQGAYTAGDGFVPLLAFVSTFCAVAAATNARLVRRFGCWSLVRGGLLLQLGISFAGLAAVRLNVLGLVEFTVIACGNLAALGMLAPNLTALSMQPFTRTAGVAAALFGSLTTVMAATLGLSIGQLFDGSAGPLLGAYALLGAAAMWLTERAREEGGGPLVTQRTA